MNQEKLVFPAPSLLVHFRKLLHKISRKSLLPGKLFGRAPPGLSQEAALGALPKRHLAVKLEKNLILLGRDCGDRREGCTVASGVIVFGIAGIAVFLRTANLREDSSGSSH